MCGFIRLGRRELSWGVVVKGLKVRFEIRRGLGFGLLVGYVFFGFEGKFRVYLK